MIKAEEKWNHFYSNLDKISCSNKYNFEIRVLILNALLLCTVDNFGQQIKLFKPHPYLFRWK